MPRVLLLEDDPMNQAVARDMLQILYPDSNVTVAADGLEGLEILGREEFDIILSDIQMPRMSGYEFVRKAREELQLTIPIISVTAFAIVGDREKLLLQGFDDYVSKPISMDLLREVLDKYLGKEVT
jgi:CheY-like chemotaxis protein